MDGRRFLKSTPDSFDVIIVNLPDPHNAQLNRFYTEEFFREAAAKLRPGGIVSFQVTSSENYISSELADFLRCLNRTLRAVFPEVAAIPGETVHFFAASQAGTLFTDPQELVRRLHARRLQTQYVREYFLPFRMSPDRMLDLQLQITPQPNTPVNHDFAPMAYYFDVALWSSRYFPASGRWIEAIAGVRFGHVLGAVGLALTLLLPCLWLWPAGGKQKHAARARRTAGFAVAAMGFTELGLEILLLLGFQALYGYVYHELTVLVALFMVGMALGAWWALRSAPEAGRTSRAGFAAPCRLATHSGCDALLVLDCSFNSGEWAAWAGKAQQVRSCSPRWRWWRDGWVASNSFWPAGSILDDAPESAARLACFMPWTLPGPAPERWR